MKLLIKLSAIILHFSQYTKYSLQNKDKFINCKMIGKRVELHGICELRPWFSGRTRPCQGRDAVSITATRTKD